MKTRDHKTARFLLAITAGLIFASAPAAENAEVFSPTKRQQTLDGAKKLLEMREVSPSAAAHDPFHPAAFAELVGSLGQVAGVSPPANESATHAPTGPRNDRELLQVIATSLKPSGYFVIGGQETLVFGQKRVKAGGALTITFEGSEYTLEVTAIHRTNFTLRLNREEFTRPIK